MSSTDMISAEMAKIAALRETGLMSARFLTVELLSEQPPLYCLDYATDELRYCCYIDALTGEMLGLDFRPCER